MFLRQDFTWTRCQHSLLSFLHFSTLCYVTCDMLFPLRGAVHYWGEPSKGPWSYWWRPARSSHQTISQKTKGTIGSCSVSYIGHQSQSYPFLLPPHVRPLLLFFHYTLEGTNEESWTELKDHKQMNWPEALCLRILWGTRIKVNASCVNREIQLSFLFDFKRAFLCFPYPLPYCYSSSDGQSEYTIRMHQIIPWGPWLATSKSIRSQYVEQISQFSQRLPWIIPQMSCLVGWGRHSGGGIIVEMHKKSKAEPNQLFLLSISSLS